MKKKWCVWALPLLCAALALLPSCGTVDPAVCTHSWTGTTDVYPTCTAVGNKTVTCTRCGIRQTVELDPIGHDWETVYTYTETEHYYVCAHCGEKKRPSEHIYAEYAAAYVAPTCHAAGARVEKCKCGSVKVTDLPATGNHQKSAELYKDAVSHYYECTSCHERIEEKAHTFGTGVTEGASATSCLPGTTTYTCTACGYQKAEQKNSTASHTIVFTQSAGTLTMSCSVCKTPLGTLTCRGGTDFEKYSVGDHPLGTGSAASEVREDAASNHYLYWIDDDAVNNVSYNLGPTENPVLDLTVIAFRFCFNFEGSTFANLGMDIKTNDSWGTGVRQTITRSATNSIVVEGQDTGVIPEKDEWYDCFVVIDRANKQEWFYINGVATLTKTLNDTDIYMQPGAYMSYLHMKLQDDYSNLLADDIFLYNADINLVTRASHYHTWDAGTEVNHQITYTCPTCGAQKTE